MLCSPSRWTSRSHGLWRSGGGPKKPQVSPSPPHLAPAVPFFFGFGTPLPYVFPVSCINSSAVISGRLLASTGLSLLRFSPSSSQFTLGQVGPAAPKLSMVTRPYSSRRSRAAHEPLHASGLAGGRQTSKFPLQFGTLSTGRDLHYWVASATCPPHRSFHAPRQSFPFPTTGERRLPLPVTPALPPPLGRDAGRGIWGPRGAANSRL